MTEHQCVAVSHVCSGKSGSDDEFYAAAGEVPMADPTRSGGSSAQWRALIEYLKLHSEVRYVWHDYSCLPEADDEDEVMVDDEEEVREFREEEATRRPEVHQPKVLDGEASNDSGNFVSSIAEHAINVAENITGQDLDGDGDVGEMGRPAVTRMPPPATVRTYLTAHRRAERRAMSSNTLSLFLGCRVVVLVEGTYTSSAHLMAEAFVAMQRVAFGGLRPAAVEGAGVGLHGGRCEIIICKGPKASPRCLEASLALEEWAMCNAREAIEKLHVMGMSGPREAERLLELVERVRKVSWGPLPGWCVCW